MISRVLQVIDWTRGDGIYFTADLPIPDCFNEPIKVALPEGDFSHIFIVEEDIVLNYDTLESLLEADVDIATCDYNMGNGQRVVSERKGFTLAGTGCTLIKTSVMRELMPFSSDTWYDLDLNPTPKIRDDGYGMQDIDFYVRAQNKGYTVKVIGEVKHLKVVEYGKAGTNNGFHKIEERL